jgi:ribosome-binding protein aMBF1 (putative translation factor)
VNAPTIAPDVLHLADIRLARGWSQDDLGFLLGRSASLIAEVEVGRRTLSPDDRVRLKRLLRLDARTARRVAELAGPEEPR